MSGKYKGMKTKILNINKLAIFLPCAAHSLNLVGSSGVDCWALLQFLPPPPFFMIDYDREFHADSEKYKNIALKINGKCSNSTSKF